MSSKREGTVKIRAEEERRLKEMHFRIMYLFMFIIYLFYILETVYICYIFILHLLI